MSRLTIDPETEFEDESEDEFEQEGESEDFLGSLLGEEELEEEYEDEDESEFEAEFEEEWEDEGEAEGEEFFKKLLKKGLPILKVLAKTAGPMLATAVGGPAAGMLARAVTSQLEGEGEDEFEDEGELEAELESMAAATLPSAQALGEFFAAQAAESESESEAEAFVGAAALSALSARDRRDLQRMLPALLRGAAVLTRLLRTDPRTRPAVRLVPGIVDATGRTLLQRRRSGQPIRTVDVGRVMGGVTRQVLGRPGYRNAVIRRHARGVATYRRPLRAGSRPVRGSTVAGRGTVRVVTPVRVPGTGRTVRVVTNVRVPRGAVVTGRPRAVAARPVRTGRR